MDSGEEALRRRAVAAGSSLLWRLPLAISVLTTAVLATLLWVAYRQVESTLVHEGGSRAQAAAGQLVRLLERSAREGDEEMRRLAADSELRLALVAGDAERARARLAELVTTGPRRVALWNGAGSRIAELEVSGSPQASVGIPVIDRAPDGLGRSPLSATGTVVYADHAVELRGGAREDDRLLALLVVRATVGANPPGIIGRLVGPEARVALGGNGGVWTDFSGPVAAPPADVDRIGVQEDRSPSGERWVGALASVEGAPYNIWVAFPRDLLAAPARAYLRRMLAIVALFVLATAISVRWLTGRILAPLSALTLRAEAIAAGDYSPALASSRRDEIGTLSRAFDTMAATVERDIAHRERAEAALREREASFRALFAANPLPMWVYDEQTLRFLEVNQAAIDHYGYSREEFLAMTLEEIRPPEDVERLRSYLREPREARQESGTWRHRRRSGEILQVEITSHTLPFEGRPSVLVVAEDVTERMRFEEQLRQAQKMEAIGRLAGGVAHDFNNMLTAILGYANLLNETLATSESRREIDEIIRAAERAADLTRQLLAFSRKQILQPKLVDLAELVQETGRMLHRLLGETVQLEIPRTEGLAPVLADPTQLEQIVVNLALNGRDAMPGGGRLTIEAANVHLDATYAAGHATVTPGPYVMLTVTDTGVGMDEETRQRAFEPFFTTKTLGKGTGLGLSTVYGIVKQSGGHIWVYSEPGHGTTFKVYLPAAEGSVQEVVQRAETTHARARGSETVLLVEDDAAVRGLTRTILQRAGYLVLEASSPNEAEIAFREHSDSIALLLTDLVMAGSSGQELYRQLAGRRASLKVLFMSGYSDDALVRDGHLGVGMPFIEKPFTSVLLLRKVREVLDR